MRNKGLLLVIVVPLLLCGCKGEKKLSQYSSIYKELPSVVYIAPLNDMSKRRAIRAPEDSAYNASLNTATKQLYLTAAAPLVYNGYYVLGPLSSAQLAATETRTGKQLRNDPIGDYKTDLGVDAVLFITLHNWRHTTNEWIVYVEYVLRSTTSNAELMHVWVRASKNLITDYKGVPQPLKSDIEFAERLGCDVETAQRCQLVETLNRFVLKDLPAGRRAREHRTERYISSHPEYFSLQILRDGSVEMSSSLSEEDTDYDGFSH